MAGRAFRLIADGVVDREGVPGLAGRLGFSERQLGRVLGAEVGAGPVALARAQRAQTARTLIESTELPFAQVALRRGLRQHPSVQRHRARRCTTARRPRCVTAPAGAARQRAGAIELRLPCRGPFDGEALLTSSAARAVPGVEAWPTASYRRTLRLERGAGSVALTPERAAVNCRLRLDDLGDLTAAVARCRRLLDLDADPGAVAEHLGADPLLGASVRARPGLRVPGCVDGFEQAVRAVVGQQVSVAGARTVLGRLASDHGERAQDGQLLFPSAAALADTDPAQFPFPRGRGEALRELARLVLDGRLDLDAGADPEATRATLLGIRGIGPWTASYVGMRALGDPDAWLPGDVGVRNALAQLGRAADETVAEGWRPWRSYAVVALWATLGPSPDRTASAART